MLKWSEQFTRLEARRAELTDELLDIEDRLDDEPSKDWEDRASERQGDEVLESLGTRDVSEIRQIDAALARIADGTYGECMTCGGKISAQRLDAVPATPFCKTCAH
jgi:RNA polymerase-binding transcription factor DksA